jgi:hypothetical protein
MAISAPRKPTGQEPQGAHGVPGSGTTDSTMASDRKSPQASAASPHRAPEWADGLKQLYDSVVEEDLPDSFKNLLARLDEIDPRRGSAENGSPSQSPDGRGAQR